MGPINFKWRSRRRRIILVCTGLFAILLLLCTTTVLLTVSDHVHRRQLLKRKLNAYLEGQERISRITSSGSMERHEIQGLWKELYASLGFKDIPDELLYSEPFPIESSETELPNERDHDITHRNRLKRKRELGLEHPDTPSSGQPILFLADDSRSAPVESLEHLQATFKALANRDQFEKGRSRRLGRILPR